MKCVIAMMQHESNTFSPIPTPVSAFGRGVGLELPPTGNRAIEKYGNADFAFAGMLAVAREKGAFCRVPIAAYAEPSGKVDDTAFEHICGSICESVKEGCDAVLLDLHGAMVTHTHNDGEGELLCRIRKVSPNVAIAVALDFHTNLTSAMVDNCTVIDGYRTYPHTDMYATGERAARTLIDCLNNGIATKMSWQALPMMTHMIKQTPSFQPMKDIMDMAIEAVENSDVLNASVFGGFPLADIPYVSFSVLVVEPIEKHLGEKLLEQLCELAWERRHDFIFVPEPLVNSISAAKQFTDFPVVIADHGDNSGAGGSADDLTVLKEMLRQNLSGIIAGPFWDAAAVEQLIACGEGNSQSVTIGGKTSVSAINQIGCSLSCTGTVKKITDGTFTVTGPMQTGFEVCLGQTVVLDIGAAKIVLCEERWEPSDPGFFYHAGIEPENYSYILIKSRQHFRAGFESIARHIVLAAGPGVCSSSYEQFNFKKLNRPIFPLDREMSME